MNIVSKVSGLFILGVGIAVLLAFGSGFQVQAGLEAGTPLAKRIAQDPTVESALQALKSLKVATCNGIYVDSEDGAADLMVDITQDPEVGHLQFFTIEVHCSGGPYSSDLTYEIVGALDHGRLYLDGIRLVKSED